MNIHQRQTSREIEQWVHDFLLGRGNNVAFSKGLKLESRVFERPKMMALSQFTRCCGPEDSMKYFEPREAFESRVHAMVEAVQDGWEMPPLIIKYSGDTYELNDGNHRLEALKRLGFERYWIILWDTEYDYVERLIKKYYAHASGIEKLSGGHVKRLYKFYDNGYKVFNLSEHHLIGLNGLSTRTLELEGVYKNFNFEIYDYIEGNTRDELEDQSVIEILIGIHKPPQEGGFGFIGQTLHDSLAVFVDVFFSDNQEGYWHQWTDLFNQGLLEEGVFDKYLRVLKDHLHYSQDKRYIVHGDFHHKNILRLKGQITRVIDWDNAMYMDYVYDLVTYWPHVKAPNFLKEDYERAGFDVSNFEKRWYVMKLFRALDALRFFARAGDKTTYEALKNDLYEITQELV